MLSSLKVRLLFVLTACSSCIFAFGDQIKVDNDVVRIVETVQAPHSVRSMPPRETSQVLISLSPGEIVLTYRDGRSSRHRLGTGQALWIPASASYTSGDAGDSPMRLIEIELINRRPASPARRDPRLDPVAIDPKHNIALLENDQVRVFRSWREPGATEMMHEHTGAGRAAVLLTDLDASVRLAEGSTSALRASAGDVLWSGTVIHATTNLGSKKFDMVVVEVK